MNLPLMLAIPFGLPKMSISKGHKQASSLPAVLKPSFPVQTWPFERAMLCA
jgi:hypothetical protein